MYNKLVLFATSTVLFAGSAFAGEVGVTNSYGHSFRAGTGSSNVQWTTNSQLTEQSSFGAIKIETSSYNGNSNGNSNNGFGNGDQDAPGRSGPRNNAENAGGGQNGGGGQQPSVPFSDRALAGSFSFGTRNYTENTQVTGSSADTYSFGSTNFSHSVGAFSR